MANLIKLKSSAVPGKVPTTSDLALRELGVNVYDGKLFLKKSTTGSETGAGTSIIEVGGGGGGVLNELDGGSAASVFTVGALTALDGGAA